MRFVPFSLYAKISLVIFVGALFSAHAAFAATLSFVPSEQTYEVGDTFVAQIQLNSGGTSVNAVSGVVSFDPTLLEVTSVSKNGSMLSLWVAEPVANNTQGTLSLEGIALNPGFVGTGKVVGVTFRAKKAGVASLTWSGASVLANDGVGTEVLSAFGRAVFAIEHKTAKPAAPQEEPTAQSLPPKVSIKGDADFIIREASASFLFDFEGRSAEALRLLFDGAPTSNPTVTYTPPILEKEIADIPEGTSYLHVQSKAEEGWSEVLHVEVIRDGVAPTVPYVTSLHDEYSEVGIFHIAAEDLHSGISYIEVAQQQGVFTRVSSSSAATFVTGTLSAGSYTLVVRAYDKAGNMAETEHVFTIKERTDVSSVEDTGGVKDTFSYLLMFVPLVLLCCALVGGSLYIFWLHRRYRRAVARETHEALSMVTSSFELILSDIRKDSTLLEKTKKKRTLTREESKVLKNLTLTIKGAQAVIEKEIVDIQRQ